MPTETPKCRRDKRKQRRKPPKISIAKTIMLVYGATSGVIDKPGRDAGPVEAAKAFQTRHGDANLELLEANGALGGVDAVLLCSSIGKHAGPASG